MVGSGIGAGVVVVGQAVKVGWGSPPGKVREWGQGQGQVERKGRGWIRWCSKDTLGLLDDQGACRGSGCG